MINYSEIFTYSAGKLQWKVKKKGRRIGDVAGCLKKNGYVHVMADGVQVYAHRVVWCMFNGAIPDGMDIDHLNGLRSDNRIENLRVVSRQENQLNKKKLKSNTSGVTGVSYSKRDKLWIVQFVGKHVGSFKSFIEACEARIVAEVSSGLCTERHGK